jgi:hypothetical protein
MITIDDDFRKPDDEGREIMVKFIGLLCVFIFLILILIIFYGS